MIREMIMPQLGMGMSEGIIAEWAVAEGARVEREQQLLSVETEKVITELPSPYAGFVHILVPCGTTVPVEKAIAQIAATREEYETLVGGSASVAPEPPMASESAGVAAQPETPRRIKASGLARKLARDRGIDLAEIAGTGPAGRIVRRDVDNAMPKSPLSVPQVAFGTVPVHDKGIREKARIPLVGVRRTIADRMAKAKTQAAHTYSVFEIDVTKLMAVRQTLRDHDKSVSMTAIFAKALAIGCREVPICNAALIDDEIVLWDEVNVAIGVSLPGRSEYESALVVPVVRNVDAKGLQQIDSEIRALVARAREGKLTAQDQADATITLSSTEKLNNGGWMVGTPLLSLPQVVAFGPGAPVRKPVLLDDGQIVPGSVLPCSLSFDHRAMDGEPAARLIRKITEVLSNPELMLL